MRTNRTKSRNGSLAGANASQRVRDYLDNLRNSLKPGETLRIPPVRQLSRDLGVSKATIYHVFKEMTNSGDLVTAVGRGSFIKADSDRITIGLNWSTDASQPFTRIAAITHALFHLSNKAGNKRIELLPMPEEVFHVNKHIDHIYHRASQVDAMIYAASAAEYGSERDAIIQSYEEQGKPVVLLDSPALNSTRNFVAPDMFGITRQLAYGWVRSGRKRIAFLMRDSVNATVTTLHCLIGLASGIAMAGDNDQRAIRIFCRSVSEEAGYHSMRRYLETHKEAPDAIYCFGDLLAWGAITALEEKGLSIPDEVSIIGGTGFGAHLPTFGRFSVGNLTRVRFSFESIARELLHMVTSRVQQQGVNMPGIYVPGTLIRGITTRAEENAYFPIDDPVLVAAD